MDATAASCDRRRRGLSAAHSERTTGSWQALASRRRVLLPTGGGAPPADRPRHQPPARRAPRRRAARGARPRAGRGIHALAQPAARPPTAAAPPDRRRARPAPAPIASSRATCGAASRSRPPPNGCSTTSTSSKARCARSATTFPTRYYRELPKLATRELAGTARVYAMAVELLRYSDARLDAQRLNRFIHAYQTVAPLTIGELWAWPSMLKLALIEHLRRLSEELIESRAGPPRGRSLLRRLRERASERPPAAASRRSSTSRSWISCCSACASTAPARPSSASSSRSGWRPPGTTVEDAVRAEHQRQAMNHLSMGNSITSLRLCSTLDWNEYVEGVSLIEQILQRDPPGVYRRMEFASRDRYRHAVEALADPTGEAQVRVALRAIESARQAAEKLGADAQSRARGLPPDRARPARSSRPTWRTARPPSRRLKRLPARARHAALTSARSRSSPGLGVAAAVAAARAARAPQSARGSGWALLALIPASEFAVALMHRLVHRIARPWPLPRLDLRGGVPEHARTMVIVPTLISSVEGARALRRAPRGARARQHGSAHPLRAAHRLPGRAGRAPPRRGRSARGGDRGDRGAQRALRARHGRPLLPVPPRTPLERQRGRVDGLGAQARQDRGVQPAAARRRRHELRRAGGRPRDPAAASATASRSTATLGCRATRRGS